MQEKQQLYAQSWHHFWNRQAATPTHLTLGLDAGKALCGKPVYRDVARWWPGERARHHVLCRACKRAAAARYGADGWDFAD